MCIYYYLDSGVWTCKKYRYVIKYLTSVPTTVFLENE